MELNSYLEQLEEQIRNRKAKAEVIEEIRNHIEDQAEFYEKEGMSAEEAIEQAVRQMGDPVEVGIEMDRIHRPKPGRSSVSPGVYDECGRTIDPVFQLLPVW